MAPIRGHPAEAEDGKTVGQLAGAIPAADLMARRVVVATGVAGIDTDGPV
jgi:hypothetical protein